MKMLHETGKLWPALGLVEKLDDAADVPNGVVHLGALGSIQLTYQHKCCNLICLSLKSVKILHACHVHYLAMSQAESQTWLSNMMENQYCHWLVANKVFCSITMYKQPHVNTVEDFIAGLHTWYTVPQLQPIPIFL
jgi:hypothetical protein